MKVRASFSVLVLLVGLFLSFPVQVLSAPGDIVRISELSAWGYQSGGTSTTWAIHDGIAKVKFDVLSSYAADHFNPEGRIEKMYLPIGGYQAVAYRLKGNYFLEVCQGEKYYQESGRYRFPMVVREFCQKLSVSNTQARQVSFNVEVKPYEATQFHLSGDYLIEMREMYCPQGAENCQWSPWKKVFSREITERREWFTNAQVRADPFGSGQWWRLEREAGVLIPSSVPSP